MFVENYYGDSRRFFNEHIKKLKNNIISVVGDKSDKKKAQMMIECMAILREVNRVLAENGEKILNDAVGDM